MLERWILDAIDLLSELCVHLYILGAWRSHQESAVVTVYPVGGHLRKIANSTGRL